MMTTITAVYEHGVLRPLTPLDLPEHSQVEVDVRTISSPPDANARRELVRAALAAAGILAPVAPVVRASLSEAERAALAERLASPEVLPLSQMIIEDREER